MLGSIISVAIFTALIAYFFHWIGPHDPEGRHDGYATGEAWKKEREKNQRNGGITIIIGIIIIALILITRW